MEPTHVSEMITSDGVALVADVFLPATRGPHPAILLRSPYDRTSVLTRKMIDIERCLARGYAVVIQDTRGRFASGGVFAPFHQEIDDGAETVMWLAGQEFCSGDVVMAGSSYLGATQWLAALSGVEELKAIAPALTSSDYHEGWIYQGGAFQLAFNLFWALVHLLPEEQRRRGITPHSAPATPAYRDTPDDTSFAATASHSLDVAGPWLDHLPLSDITPLEGAADFYNHWLAAAAPDDAYWSRISPERNAARIRCPVLVTSGWYQLFVRGAYEGFRAVTTAGATEAARTRSRMIIGPWENSLPGPHNTTAGELDFGPDAGLEFTDTQLDFFDDVLVGSAAPVDPIRYFVMGADEWRTAPTWPPPGTRWRTLFFGPEGVLTDGPPTRGGHDTTTSDPTSPVPTLGGCTVPGLPQGPRDHASLDARDDCAVYRTTRLDAPLEIIGPVKALLHASVSGPSVDFVVMLSVEHPDGRVINLCDGITRWSGTPGDVTVEVDLLATAAVVPAGCRLHARVAHSNYPRFDRNLGTGEPAPHATVMSVAQHRIDRRPGRASSLLLSVRP